MLRQIFSVSDLVHLLNDGAQLVDVLGQDEFGRDHIPGAINLPLKKLSAASVSRLDRDRPVVVYCNDFG